MRPSEGWREKVLARQRQMDAAYARLKRTSADFWERRAGRYQQMARVAEASDPVVTRVVALAGPAGRVLDVGAGTGRYALALAPLVRQVTALEPAPAMAGRLREGISDHGFTNIEVIEKGWLEAQVTPHDVVLCAHVLYPHADVLTWMQRLDAAAVRAVVLAMMADWSEPPLLAALWRRFHGDERLGQPEAADAIAVLEETGVTPHVETQAIAARAPMWAFHAPEDALAPVREHLIVSEADAPDSALLPLLRTGLRQEDDGLWTMAQPQRSVTVIWYEKP